jgi:hypothetical protein
MISELVTIEHYFGRLEAVMTLEDLVRRYGRDKVDAALAADQLELKCSFCRVYALLTDRAREDRDSPYDAPVPAL